MIKTIKSIKIQLLGEGKFAWFAFALFMILLCIYPVYTNIMYGQGYCQYTRQIEWLDGNSQFFNPWQYRILSPIIIECIHFIFCHSIDYVFSIKHFFPQENEEVIRYYIIFCLLRSFQNLIVLALLYSFYKQYIKDFRLLIFTLLLCVLFMSNSVYDSDFSFNTYFDIIFYLLAALAGLQKRPFYQIIILTALAALNRETSGFIPLIYGMFYAGSLQQIFRNRRLMIVMALSTIAYCVIFVSIRQYYGGPATTDWFPGFVAGVKLNFQMPRLPLSIMEPFGIVLIFPFVALAWRKRTDLVFRQLALIVIPVWVLIHLSLFIQEARIFLVPVFVILIPMAMQGWINRVESIKE
ncbi:MAG: hypothetical protein ABIV51_10590 [Saprospiraceae bacterium]